MAIRILPSQLIDQIAAGEVVERPASVVKELVENSLDAGARSIAVDVEGGGASLIRVTDDGCGIPRDELALALSRHATSKIATLDDLEGSRVDGLSRRGAAEHRVGCAVDADVARRSRRARVAGRVQRRRARRRRARPRAPCGTTVEVRDLFFNTPARRKFQRVREDGARPRRRGAAQSRARAFRRRVPPCEQRAHGVRVAAPLSAARRRSVASPRFAATSSCSTRVISRAPIEGLELYGAGSRRPRSRAARPTCSSRS